MDNQGSLNAQKTAQVTMDNETPTVGAITMSVNIIRHKTNDTPVRSIFAEILHSFVEFSQSVYEYFTHNLGHNLSDNLYLI